MAKMEEKAHPSFSAFFKGSLLPILEKLERFRMLRFAAYGIILAGVAALWLAGAHRLGMPYQHRILGLLWIAWGGIFLVGITWFFRAFDLAVLRVHEKRGLFSRGVVGPTVRRAAPRLKHLPGEFISLTDFIACGLFTPDFVVAEGRDLFYGGGKGYTLTFSWLRLVKPRRFLKLPGLRRGLENHGGREIFAGWYFVVNFPRNFRGETVVMPDVAESQMSWLGRMVQEATARDVVLHLEDAEFEVLFKAVSSGELEGRYVLTPIFMRSAVAAGKALGGKMYLSFRDNQMFVIVPFPSRHFELTANQPFIDLRYCRKLYRMTRGVLDMAEAVAAHQTVWRT